MIDLIFTLDYEIYGDGTGSLREQVLEPAERLREIFAKWDLRFVNFVEVAELEKIEAFGSDPTIDLIRNQIREMHADGFETALHLHPQWYNAQYENRRWILDQKEYNLCTLSRPRIEQIVHEALAYLSHLLGRGNYVPLSFRAGNWLFQPTPAAAAVLSECGIRLDSSVFKGGLQHKHGLDYRRAPRDAYYWQFSSDVMRPDPAGCWTEIPIHTEMLPVWAMATAKRMSFAGAGQGIATSRLQKLDRLRDFMRFRYPKKLDFCRMTADEMTQMVGHVLRADRLTPEVYKPLVAIGHTKDFCDLQALDTFLGFLVANRVRVATFEQVYEKMAPNSSRRPDAQAVVAAVKD